MSEQKFDFTRSAHYALTLRVSSENFTFAAYNADEDQPFYIHSYPTNLQCSATANLKNILQNNDFGKYTFKKVRILLCDIPHTIVPKEIVEETDAATLYHSCYPHFNNEMIMYTELSRYNLIMLYAADKTFMQLLKEYFPDAEIVPSTLPVMEHLLRKNRTGGNRKLFVWIKNKQIEVFAFTPDQFLLNNTFSNLHQRDYTYYILNVWSQLEFDQEKDNLYLFGNTPEKHQICTDLQSFIAHVGFLNPTSEFQRADFSLPNVPFDVQASLVFAENQ